jgi:hypothetical protein
MAVLNRGGYANVFARRIQLPSFPAALAKISPPSTQRRIKFHCCKKEIKWLEDKLESKAYKLERGYGDYGSTEGEWRLLNTRPGRTKLPSPAGVRRSKRLQAMKSNAPKVEGGSII